MKIRKPFISFASGNRKKTAAAAALLVCVGMLAAVGGIEPDKTVNEEIPVHDGDVLVTSDEVVEPENTDTYFQELRATLDMDRNKIIALLTDAEGSASTSDEKKEASAEKMRLLNYMEQEKTVEALIKNKGLPDSFVVITDTGVNVTVNTENLDQDTVTKICEIVMRQTDRKATEIVVQDVS